MKSKKLPNHFAGRLVMVAAPKNWNAMFKKDPVGPEIQAFLNRAVQADESPTLPRTQKPTKSRRKTAAKPRSRKTRHT